MELIQLPMHFLGPSPKGMKASSLKSGGLSENRSGRYCIGSGKLSGSRAMANNGMTTAVPSGMIVSVLGTAYSLVQIRLSNGSTGYFRKVSKKKTIKCFHMHTSKQPIYQVRTAPDTAFHWWNHKTTLRHVFPASDRCQPAAMPWPLHFEQLRKS